MSNIHNNDYPDTGPSFQEGPSDPGPKPRPPQRRGPSRGRPIQKKKEPVSAGDQLRTSRPSPSRPVPRKTVKKSRPSEVKPRITNPIIGLTASYHYHPEKTDVYFNHHYVWDQYISAVHQAGGVPVIIPVGLEGRYANKIFDSLHGLLLTGGGDVDPNLYDSSISAKVLQVDPRKDRTEIDLFNLAFNKNIPIFGICRGAQIINVALDGTLYQDIASQVKMASLHMPDFPYNEPCHKVHVESDTKLYRALGESRIWVNSIHHQGIKLHGKGLVVSARSNDGIIEGIEHPTKKWVVGVQWHPELMTDDDKIHAMLFKAFVDACRT